MAKRLHQDCGNKAGNLKWARQAHLARSGSQSEYRICFILPARGASHIINVIIVQLCTYYIQSVLSPSQTPLG